MEKCQYEGDWNCSRGYFCSCLVSVHLSRLMYLFVKLGETTSLYEFAILYNVYKVYTITIPTHAEVVIFDSKLKM